MDIVEFVARIRFLVWTMFQLGAGQPYNRIPTEDQWESVKDGVRFGLEHPDMTPEQNHDNWVSKKTQQGWVWGPEKDAEKKTHPDLVAYDALPDIEKAKDDMDLFIQAEAVKLWERIHEDFKILREFDEVMDSRTVTDEQIVEGLEALQERLWDDLSESDVAWLEQAQHRIKTIGG